MNKTKDKDKIRIIDVFKKIPNIVKSAPYIYKGLRISKPKPEERCGLAWAIEKNAKDSPDLIAIKCDDGDMTYGTLNNQANKISHYLLSVGLVKGDIVCVLIENRIELLVVVVALAKIGAVSSMINTSQKGKALVHSFSLVSPKACVIGEEFIDSFNDIKSDLNIENTFFVNKESTKYKHHSLTPDNYINLLDESSGHSAKNPSCSKNIHREDPLFYIYTSGTTGLPKAGVFTNGRWMKAYGGFGIASLKMNNKDTLYCTLPLYHATGLCVCWGAAISGCSAFAIKRRFSARNFWKDVEFFNATTIGYVGELCRYLIDQPLLDTDRNNSAYKMIGNGLRPNVWNEFKIRFGIDFVYEFYAASDGNIGFTNIFNFDNTIGFSPMSWEVIEYDIEAEEPVKDNNGFYKKIKSSHPGLLIAEIDDDNPLDGYTDPEKTKKVILENVFKKGDRYFNTGDLIKNIGFGHAQFVDRLGDTFRWKGENVSTNEVENIISEFQSICDAVVYGIEIPNTNGRAGMASITINSHVMDFNFDDFSDFVFRELPNYAIPLFIRVKEEMEMTGTFKYQKSKLKHDGFDVRKTRGEPVYGILPGTKTYKKLDFKDVTSINEGIIRY